MTTKKCPACGAVGTARFCADCGTSLTSVVKCVGCGHQPPAGAKFCNMCGQAIGSSTAGVPAGRPAGVATSGLGPGNLPWIVAGVATVILAGVLIIPRLRSEPAALDTAAPSVQTPVSGPSSIDLDSMTPREAADRLFTRVMTSISTGDSLAAVSFAPMALGAYDLAEPLDLDGRYHVATLHLVAGNTAAAAAESAAILDEVPTHLLGLFTAAQAASAEGRLDDARAYYARLIENYDAELATARLEYSAHVNMLPEIRREAEAFGFE